MMHFKNDGFALIEAMFAVLLIGIVLSSLFLLENTVVENVGTLTQRYRRFLFAHNFLYEARRNQPLNAKEFTLEQKKNIPTTQLKYELKPVSEKSDFKNMRNLYKETITITGPERAPKEFYIAYRFKKQEPKK